MSSDDDIVAVRERAAKRPRQVDGVLECAEIVNYNESNRLYDVKYTYCSPVIRGSKPIFVDIVAQYPRRTLFLVDFDNTSSVS
jgi:hypothetical protein